MTDRVVLAYSDQGLAKVFVQLWGLPSKIVASRAQRVAGGDQ